MSEKVGAPEAAKYAFQSMAGASAASSAFLSLW